MFDTSAFQVFQDVAIARAGIVPFSGASLRRSDFATSTPGGNILYCAARPSFVRLLTVGLRCQCWSRILP